MRVIVKYYAILTDITKSSSETISFDGNNVEDLIKILTKKYPKLKEFLKNHPVTILVNKKLCTNKKSTIKDGDLIELLPPSSGGGYDEARILNEKESINLNEMIYEIKSKLDLKKYGALAIYVGVVKGEVNGKKVRELEYVIHEEFTLSKFNEIINEIKRKYKNIALIKIFHKKGCFKPGDEVIYIIVLGVSRRDVFPAISEIMERVKHETGIWKIERREDGEFWVLGDGQRIKRKMRSSCSNPYRS